MTDWAVTVTTALRSAATESQLEDLLDVLIERGAGAVTSTGRTISSTMTLHNQPDALAASIAGANTLTVALSTLDIEAEQLTGIEAITTDEQDRQLGMSTIPPLVGASEAAAILKVSRQRIHQLHTSHSDFPPPAVEAAMGPLWLQAAIEGFDRRWTRKPGPRTQESPAEKTSATAAKNREKVVI